MLQKFKIDLDHVKKRNDELISLNWIDKLSKKQKKYLNFRKGSHTIMNKDGLFGYLDISNYLINPDKFSEIDSKHLSEYLVVYQLNSNIYVNITNNDITEILNKIQQRRIKAIQKYLDIEDSIFKRGIYVHDIVYRMQNGEILGNIIKNATSWSLSPILFCGKDCHLYVTRIPKNIKVIYVENNSKDKTLQTFQKFHYYEFEFILPRNLEFVEVHNKIIYLHNEEFGAKDPTRNINKVKIIVHIIKIKK